MDDSLSIARAVVLFWSSIHDLSSAVADVRDQGHQYARKYNL